MAKTELEESSRRLHISIKLLGLFRLVCFAGFVVGLSFG